MLRTVTRAMLATLLTLPVAAVEPRVVFEDRFEGAIGEGWSWLREHSGAWRLRDGALEIRVEPGVAHNVRNALVRPAPDRTRGTYAIEVTITSTVAPTNQYEQAGITWYSGGRPVAKFVKERIDGKIYVFPGKIPMDRPTVQLRLVVSAEGAEAQFRPDGEGEYRTAAKLRLPKPADDQVSIQCYNGPPDAAHWIRFDDFRILRLDGGEEVETGPFLHPVFTDHMVLQRDIPARVWGWAKPGSGVSVEIAGRSASTRAAANGRWMAKLPALPAGGPHTLSVKGPRTVTLEDVLVGDVWICSGQSNMEWPVAASNRAPEEIAAASHPGLRLYTVPKRISLRPERLVDGSWAPCSPTNVGGFSAVGYFFGRKLHAELEVPIGLIHTSWGGTVAEAWTSAEALRAMEDFRPAVDQLQEVARAGDDAQAVYDRQIASWWRENDPGSRDRSWARPDVATGDWKEMRLPAAWESAGLDSYDGIVWFRREIELPADWAGKPATLRLGPVDDIDTTFVNGRRVGEGSNWAAPRTYQVPAGVLVGGRNVVAVRVLDTGGAGGLGGSVDQYELRDTAGRLDSVPLGGAWSYRAASPLGKLPPVPRRPGSDPNVVTVLYNGMVAPLVPLAIRGAIWYQGESNAGRPEQYARLLPAMIRDWRARFGVGDFPFLVVQLANFMAPQKEPVEAGWAYLREAQYLTARRDPRVGLAVTLDIGEANDIHPRNKQDVGLRLALSALHIAHGLDLVHSGPEYDGMEVHGREAHIRFRHVGGGLAARGGEPLVGFAIAGKDGRFVWADAKIRGDTVIATAAAVAEPVAVRYAWANNPRGNLVNREGLPASSFRTDVDAD